GTRSLAVFFFQAEDGIRAFHVTGVQTCALPICAFTAPKKVLSVCSAILYIPSNCASKNFFCALKSISILLISLILLFIKEFLSKNNCLVLIFNFSSLSDCF